MIYYYGTQSVINPTAQQSLNNNSFYLFLVYSSAALGLAIISLKTKSVYMFFILFFALSILWLIFKKAWQYTPV